MKHIKLFENFVSNSDIDKICKRYFIENYTINDDFSIDVEGDVDLSGKGLIELPLKFRNVTGWFDCSHNNLTNLFGAPISVEESFFCSHNDLSDLEYAPNIVNLYFGCSYNNLKTLKGAPNSVNGLDCSYTTITDLKGAPNYIKEFLNCDSTLLYSFEGFPEFIGGDIFIPFYLTHIFKMFNEDRNLIEAFNDYNIIKKAIDDNSKPRLKLSNLNRFLSDFEFKEIDYDPVLSKKYEIL